MSSLPRESEIDPSQFPGLNEALYGEEHYRYFLYRIHMLLLAVGRPSDIDRLLSEGVEFGEFRLLPQPLPDADEGGDGSKISERLMAHAATDAEVLFHHTAECLLRLYFAHETVPPCPWVEVARLRQPSVFKGRVARFVAEEASDARRQRIAGVFFGGKEPVDGSQDSETRERWGVAIDETDSFLRRAASLLLNRANLYNAAKHGLAVMAGNAIVQLGDDDAPIIRQDGMAIHYLEAKREGGRNTWCRTTAFIDLDVTLGRSLVATKLIGNLWSIARARYLGETVANLWLPPAGTGEVLTGKEGLTIEKFQIGLV